MARLVGACNFETPNKVEFDDGEMGFLGCAGDILLTGFFQDVRGKTACPICSRAINLEVRGRRVVSLQPQTALLHYVRYSNSNPTAFGIICESTFMFDGRSCLEGWLASHPMSDGQIGTPEHFLEEVILTKEGRTNKAKF